MIQNTKVIVTGGCGFIGSHLVDKLIDLSYDVHVIDDESAESNDVFYYNPKAYYYKIDIADLSVRDNYHNHIFSNASFLFHMAAESRIVPAIKDPVKATTTNVIGTVKVLELARKHQIKRVMYSSTSSVYGLKCELPTTEATPIDCLNPYSSTKLCGEEMVKLYSKMYGVDSCIFRYFNVYGERSPTKGQYAPVVGLFLKQREKNKPLIIFGNGEKRRDFIHVHDVVTANLLAMRHPQAIEGEVFNVGSGKNYSINEIASFISEDIDYEDARIGEAEHTLADIYKIRNKFGFTPIYDVKEWIIS